MTIVTTFEKRKREKQLTSERKLLRDLSIEKLKKSVLQHFNHVGIWASFIPDGVEEACFDIAIEAFLCGGEYSRFVLYGETFEMIRNRSEEDREKLGDTMYNFWLYMDYGHKSIDEEKAFVACAHFVDEWWMQGYEKGERRYKLRLH